MNGWALFGIIAAGVAVGGPVAFGLMWALDWVVYRIGDWWERQ